MMTKNDDHVRAVLDEIDGRDENVARALFDLQHVTINTKRFYHLTMRETEFILRELWASLHREIEMREGESKSIQ